MSDSYPVLTIDGPSGVGKGTIAQKLAVQLGWHLLDSGALYRSCAWALLNTTNHPEDIIANPELLQPFLQSLKITHQGDQYFCQQENISTAIREESIGLFTSTIARIPAIRYWLLEAQRQAVRSPGLIADGRDMGTNIFPQAPYKLFLDASPSIRAQRRYQQLIQQQPSTDYEQVLTDLQHRDQQDRQCDMAPLKPAKDAWVLDNGLLTIDQTITYIVNHWQL